MIHCLMTTNHFVQDSCFAFDVTHKLVWTPQVALEMLVKLWVHMGQSSSSRIRSLRFGSFVYVEEAFVAAVDVWRCRAFFSFLGCSE